MIRSSGGRASKRENRELTTIALEAGIKRVTGRDVVRTEAGTWSGDIRKPYTRKKLKGLGRLAEQLNCRLVFHRLSRIGRPAAYYDDGDAESLLGPKDYERVRDVMNGAELCVLIDPTLPESEQHGEATKFTAAAGRPQALNERQVGQALKDLDRGMSQSRVAAKYGVSVSTVKRIRAR